jgi:hypothetical protein
LKLNKETLLAIATFEIAWVLLILGHQSWWLYVALLMMLAYFIIEKIKLAPPQSVYLNRLYLTVVGVTADFLLSWFELIRFTESTYFIPIWLFLMWVLFAITFDQAYQWLANKSFFAALLGAVFGPAAYWGASKISAVEILSPLIFTVVSAVFWGILFVIQTQGLVPRLMKNKPSL